MKKYLLYFLLFITLTSCSSTNHLSENWEEFRPKNIGFIGVLPFKPYYKYESIGNVINKGLNDPSVYWWDDMVNDSIMAKLKIYFPEFEFTNISVPINRENVFESSIRYFDFMDALGYKDLDDTNKTNFRTKITELADLFNLDAIFFGYAEFYLTPTILLKGALASKYFLYSKDGNLLWNYENRIFTYNYHMTLSSLNENPYSLDNCGLMLMQETITDISNNFPHINGYNTNREKPIKLVPIVLNNPDNLVVESYYKFDFKVTNKTGQLVYKPVEKESKYIWHFEDINNKPIPNDIYFLTFDDTSKHYFIKLDIH